MSPQVPMVIAHPHPCILSRTINSPGPTGLGKTPALNEIVRRLCTLCGQNGGVVVVTTPMGTAAPLINGVTLVRFVGIKFHNHDGHEPRRVWASRLSSAKKASFVLLSIDLDQCSTPPPVVPESFMPSGNGATLDVLAKFTGNGQELTHITPGLKKISEEYASQGKTVASVRRHS